MASWPTLANGCFSSSGRSWRWSGSASIAAERGSQKKQGIAEVVPAADEDFKEAKVSENITAVCANFSEGLESVCSMTVIQGDDWVLFFNPIFAPSSVYRRLGAGKKCVVLFLPTLWHHMAADLCLAAIQLPRSGDQQVPVHDIRRHCRSRIQRAWTCPVFSTSMCREPSTTNISFYMSRWACSSSAISCRRSSRRWTSRPVYGTPCR